MCFYCYLFDCNFKLIINDYPILEMVMGAKPIDADNVLWCLQT